MSKEKEFVDLAKKLIAFKSIKTEPGKLSACADFIADFFAGPSFVVKRYEKEGKPSVVVTYQDTKSPKIFLNGHFDVVEAEEEQFYPKVEKGKLYGRGASDMKGQDAVMMVLFKDLARLERRPSLGLMLTFDEEIGGARGVKYLLNEEGYSCELVIVPDAGEKDLRVVTAEKGVLHLRIIARGKAAHGSHPWAGENAVDKLIQAYLALKKDFPDKATEEDFWYPTLNLGKLEGGEAPNKVPDYAEMHLDFRFTEKERKEEILGRVKKVCQGMEIEVLSEGAVCHIPEDHPYVQEFVRIMNDVHQGETLITRECGATDARFFAEKGIPAILSEPTGGNIHGKDEWVAVESLGKFYEVLKKFILTIT